MYREIMKNTLTIGVLLNPSHKSSKAWTNVDEVGMEHSSGYTK